MALSGGTICSIVLMIWSKTFFKQRKQSGLENENEGSNMETMNFNKTDTPKFCSFKGWNCGPLLFNLLCSWIWLGWMLCLR